MARIGWHRLAFVSAVLGLACHSGSASDTTGAGTGDDTTSGSSAGHASTGALETGGTAQPDPDSTVGGGTVPTGADTVSDATDGPTPQCGNGRIDPGEVCDDGVNNWHYNGCADDCSQFGPYCGDGQADEEHGEMCDLGDDNGNAQCNAVCMVPGTLIGSVYEQSVDVPSLNGSTMRAVFWNGAPTLVTTYGHDPTSVWELDGETIQTASLRALDVEDSVSAIRGIAALGNGHLLLASNGKHAFTVDASLAVQWTFTPFDAAASQNFVGAATTSTGATLGANHSNGAFNPPTSSYWTIGISDAGMTTWQEIEAVNASVGGTDLQGLGGDRAVQAFHMVGNPAFAAFRIFDADGQIVAQDVVQQVSTSFIEWRICAGDNSFFLFNRNFSSLTGFDLDGMPTFNAIVANNDFNATCATLSNGSPVVLSNTLDEEAFTSTLTLHGFDQATQVYQTAFDEPQGYGDQPPVILLDEERSRAWVFHSGLVTPTGPGFVYAAVVAI